MSEIDARSVGELLLQADSTARGTLWDPGPDLAQARARSWGEVAEAAADLWAAIPDRTGSPSMARVHQLASRVHHAQQRAGWPGPGPGDPDLEAVASTLARAAELVAARRHPSAPLSAAGHLDSEAARARIMHIVYVSAHAATVSLQHHMRELEHHLADRRRLAPGDSLRHARVTHARLTEVERVAGDYLHGRFPAALRGEHRDPVETPRLEQAAARWDLQAHRVLTASPTTANLWRITQTHRELVLAAGVIMTAAGSRGLVRDAGLADRIGRTFTALERSWGRLNGNLRPLIGRQFNVDPGLLHASNELRAALREITHDQTGVFTDPATMAARTDLVPVVSSLQHSLTASVDLAEGIYAALGDPDLTVAAKGAHVIAAASARPQPLAAWVDAGDLHHNRQIDMPEPVRSALLAQTDDIITAAAAASSAAGQIQRRPTPPPDQGNPLPGRSHQDRMPPSLTPVAPGVGCDR